MNAVLEYCLIKVWQRLLRVTWKQEDRTRGLRSTKLINVIQPVERPSWHERNSPFNCREGLREESRTSPAACQNFQAKIRSRRFRYFVWERAVANLVIRSSRVWYFSAAQLASWVLAMTMRYNYLVITLYVEIVCLTVKCGCVWRPLDSSYRIQWRKIQCTVTKNI